MERPKVRLLGIEISEAAWHFPLTCCSLASYVVKTIQKKLETEYYNPDTTVAILYRSNAQSRLLEEACVEHNLPYVILGKATSFYKRREVKDCLCYLRWLYNGRDAGSMLRAFQTPSRGLGDRALEQFQSYCKLVSEEYGRANRQSPTQLEILFSFLEPEAPYMPQRSDTIATRPLKLFTEFAKEMQDLYQLAQNQPVEKLLSAVINTFDLMSHFEKISDSKTEFQERQGNVEELLQATRKYSKDGPSMPHQYHNAGIDDSKSPLGAFLDDVALVTELRDGNEGENEESTRKRFVVSLMTIHASKGMEFDSVFVTGNEDMNFPTAKAIQAGKGSVALAEECRLCYVAITRAKTELFLTWRREAAVFDPSSDKGFVMVKRNRSRFLDALVAEKVGNDHGVRNRSTSKDGASSVEHGSVKSSGYDAIRNGRSSKYSSSTESRSKLKRPEVRTYRGVPSLEVQQRQTSSNQPVRRTERLQKSNFGSKTLLKSTQLSQYPSDQPQQPMRQPKVRKVNRSSSMDSTWFFPVGSKVIHKEHGRGLVLNPPPSESTKSLRVLVRFEDGRQLDFPAEGDALRHEF
jgi:ATP-dependent exoDNAse (exonuclease V) beta subunit